MKPSQNSYTPTHPGLLVQFVAGDYRSSMMTQRSWAKGEVIAWLKGLTPGPKRYTSVQCGKGPNDHIELNSDLVYINHSCEPNVCFDLSSPDRSQWQLRALRNIKAGETLEFFYPSTEWNMDQPFKCECGTKSCVGTIQGAKYLSAKVLLPRGYINSWIIELVQERDEQGPVQSRL